MIITHTCRSGNSCDICIPDTIKLGAYYNVGVEWDNYPPSAADLREYHEEVYPLRVLPLLEAAICKGHGPGNFVQIIPGLRDWIPAGLRKEH